MALRKKAPRAETVYWCPCGERLYAVTSTLWRCKKVHEYLSKEQNGPPEIEHNSRRSLSESIDTMTAALSWAMGVLEDDWQGAHTGRPMDEGLRAERKDALKEAKTTA